MHSLYNNIEIEYILELCLNTFENLYMIGENYSFKILCSNISAILVSITYLSIIIWQAIRRVWNRKPDI